MAYVNSSNNVVIAFSEKELEDILNTVELPPTWQVKAKGRYFSLMGSEQSSEIISPEAQAVLDRMSGLTEPQEQAIIKFINAESASIGNGNWDFIDEFFALPLGATNGIIGFKTKTGTNNGGTFNANGLSVSGASTFSSNFNPISDGVNFTLNNAQVETFIFENRSPGLNYNVISGALNNVTVRDSSPTRFIWWLNSLGNNEVLQGLDAPALYSFVREASQTSECYKNGVMLPSNRADISSEIKTSVITTGSGFDGVYSTLCIGGALPNQQEHYDNVAQFLKDLGVAI